MTPTTVGAASAAPGGELALTRCTNPACRRFARVRVPADDGAEVACPTCGARVGAFGLDPETGVPVTDVDQAVPEYSQVAVTVDGEQFHIVTADHTRGLFGLVAAAGEWIGGRWRYRDSSVILVHFTGRPVCTRCLRHHPPDCEA